jgi:hypothetical protein
MSTAMKDGDVDDVNLESDGLLWLLNCIAASSSSDESITVIRFSSALSTLNLVSLSELLMLTVSDKESTSEDWQLPFQGSILNPVLHNDKLSSLLYRTSDGAVRLANEQNAQEQSASPQQYSNNSSCLVHLLIKAAESLLLQDGQKNNPVLLTSF